MRNVAIISAILWACGLCVLARPAHAAAPDFDRDVASLFASHCLDCHNSTEHKADLDLSHYNSAMKGGKSGAAIVPDKLQDSLLWQNVSSDKMPKKHAPLSPADKLTIRRWIESGAKWGSDPIDPFRYTSTRRAGYDWWSLQPVRRTGAPSVKSASWASNPIDQYILAEQEKCNLTPSSQADRRTLIRRLSFDLTGLPPTPEEVSDFTQDASPDAYERLVDRLLASPQYGVRWARHWLDVIRFGESHGFERDQLRPNSWRYRDWVVDAFNSDMPYDRFVKLQLAGDALEPNNPRSLIATGFLVAGAFDEVGQTQQSLAMRAVARADEMEDIVAAVSQTFLGLTANCARCHDHKFDPISQREYYRFAAALSGVRHGSRAIPPDLATQGGKDFSKATTDRERELKKSLDEIDAPAKAAFAARTVHLPPPPQPIAEWRFDEDLHDHVGSLDVELRGNAKLVDGALRVKNNAYAATPPLPFSLTDKTLEAWVSLTGLTQHGGGAISVQSLSGDVFDAIVFGEKDPSQWMAGSDGYRRTRSFNAPPESAEPTQFVHVAIVWKSDGTIAGYRQGQPYGTKYVAANVATFEPHKACITFGLRHFPAAPSGKFLDGSILKARLYNRALSDHEILASSGANAVISEKELVALTPPDQAARRAILRNELTAIDRMKRRAESATVYACLPAESLGEMHVQIRGNPAALGEAVTPGALNAIVGLDPDFKITATSDDRLRRPKLANWIGDSQNPLLGRVIANRLWQYHFGVGIVDSPNDFGFNGGRPSHPELLDYLAGFLADNGWSLKKLQKLIVMSSTYRQASVIRPECVARDSGNRLLWRMTPRRLEAEALRDAMLDVAGALDARLGGPGFEDYYTFTRNSTFYEYHDYVGPTFNRRSLYRTWIRSGRSPMLDVFDCPDPSTKTPRRAVTITPLQALALLNDSFTMRMSQSLADAASRGIESDTGQQVRRVYERAIGRAPTDDEAREADAFVRKNGLVPFCRIMMNSSEFVTID